MRQRRAGDAWSEKRSLPLPGPDRNGGHHTEGTMKTTISALLIPLVGICMLTLASCSGGRAAEIAGPTDPTRCPSVDSALTQPQPVACPQ
jgi:hypothetical protein